MYGFNFSCQFQCPKWTTASSMQTNKNLLNCIKKITKGFFQIKIYLFELQFSLICQNKHFHEMELNLLRAQALFKLGFLLL